MTMFTPCEESSSSVTELKDVGTTTIGVCLSNSLNLSQNSNISAGSFFLECIIMPSAPAAYLHTAQRLFYRKLFKPKITQNALLLLHDDIGLLDEEIIMAGTQLVVFHAILRILEEDVCNDGTLRDRIERL